MENFRLISGMLLDAEAARMIEEKDLFEILHGLLADKKRRDKMGQASKAVIMANQGSALRTCDEILEVTAERSCQFPIH
jgi:3-deoxy-D-manno-octulosonic-acid transferase